jgi:hypothetical protein
MDVLMTTKEKWVGISRFTALLQVMQVGFFSSRKEKKSSEGEGNIEEWRIQILHAEL